jgi:hypothetical protein
VSLLTESFSLCPFVFDRIEVGRIGRKVFKGMPGPAQGVLNIGPFMEGGIIQDNDGGRRQLGQKDVLNPGEENIGIDTAFKEADGDQVEAEQGTNDIRAALSVPVPASVAALANRGIAGSTRHVLGKSTLINPHQRPPGRFVRYPSGLKGTPCGFVRARMHGCFFL